MGVKLSKRFVNIEFRIDGSMDYCDIKYTPETDEEIEAVEIGEVNLKPSELPEFIAKLADIYNEIKRLTASGAESKTVSSTD